jgi:DNA-binding LacI/PurR family transcriptional regulator
LEHAIPRELFDVLDRSSVVVVGERTSRPALDCVLNDQYLTAVEAMKKCLTLGYRRPGLCIHRDVERVVENRFSGGFLVSQGLWPADSRLPEHYYESGGEKEFVAWVRKYHPDVILTLHPEIKAWLHQMGMACPETVGLVHLDRTEEMNGWSGMRQDHEHLGTAAVEMLVNHLYHNEVGIPSFQRCLFLGSSWCAGKTTLRPTPNRNPGKTRPFLSI